MDPVIEEIKQKTDIVGLISGYLKIEKTGANYRAICPFHSEKKPSFFISPARQIWHCFGCGLGGDIFKFIMQIEGLEFGDALRLLAQRAGVELKRQDPRVRTERNRLYDICELAAKFFEKQIELSKIGQDASKYLLGRGLSEDSIKKWRVGYAPDSWQALLSFLTEKGFNMLEIDRAGLAVKKEDGKGFYDRFRGRIIFPVFDLNSQIVGFGGRVFGEKDDEKITAKYINTPNTPLYDKSRILYGLDRAKVDIRKRGECIIVEGYTDVIMSHQIGVNNAVAVSGTSLTPAHLNIMKRYTENLLMGFDMDIAGDSATKRGIDLAQREGFNIKIITMPPELDPADVIKNNPSDWEKLISCSKLILDFYFENAFGRFDKNMADGKKRISRVLIPVIKRIQNKIELSHWTEELAKKLGVPERAVREEMEKYREKEEIVEKEIIEKVRPQTRMEKLEERIVCLFLKKPEIIKNFENQFFIFDKFSDKIKKIIDLIKKGNIEKTSLNLDEEVKGYFNYLFLTAQVEEGDCKSEKEIKEELASSCNQYHQLQIRKELDLLASEIKKAENEGKASEAQELMKKFNQLSKELIKN